MSTINGRACVVNGAPVDKVFSNGKQVYGRNIQPDSNFTQLPSTWTPDGVVFDNSGEFAKLTSKGTGLQRIYGLGDPFASIPAGSQYTISFTAYSAIAGTSLKIGPFTSANLFKLTATATYYQFSATKKSSDSNALSVTLLNEGDIIYIKNVKIEKDIIATPWTPALEDVSDYGRNLLTGTGNHTVTGTATKGYLSNETNDDFLTLFKGLEGQTVTVSVDYEYSGFIAGSSNDCLGWETQIFTDTTKYFGAWYWPSYDSGSGRTSITFVVPKNITRLGYASGYIRFSGSGIGTVSHLKIEKGSVATPWTPAPEDVM